MVACSPFSKPTNVQHLHTIYCYRAIRSRIRLLLLLAVGVIYIFFSFVYMCVILLILDKQSVSKWKSVANESSVSWFDKANVKNWFFITPSFPLFTRLITIWSCYTMHSLFFSTVGSYICSFSEVAAAKLVFFLFARNAKTPIVIYDLRVWTWDNVLCFIARHFDSSH